MVRESKLKGGKETVGKKVNMGDNVRARESMR